MSEDYVYFTSGNVGSSVRTLISNPRPDTTYTIEIVDVDHIKADKSVSNLSDLYNKNLIGVTVPVSITTPPDNVTSVIDIVRTTGNNVDVYLHEFASSPYPIANYSGNLNYYTNTALTSGSTIVNLTSPSTPIISNYNLLNLKTQAYYFAAVYRNNQHRYDLATKDQVFDIRGITYIRNSAFSDPSYNLIVEPGINISSFQGNHNSFALSADGTVLLKILSITSNQQRLDIYKDRKNITTLNLSIYRSINETLVAMSGDAKRCVVAGVTSSGGSVSSVLVIPINNNLSFGTSTSLTLDSSVWNTYLIRKVSMSMDGDTILISGYKSNLSEGYAHVYTFSGTSWSKTGDLSSILVPGYVQQYSYGQTSALSGDGRTAVISGDSSDTASFKDTGYIWKYNEFIDDWVFVQKIEFGYNSQHYSLSHLGNTIFVNSTVSKKWAVFEYDDDTKQYTRSGLEREITINNMSSGSISGDGNTIVYTRYMESSTGSGANIKYIYILDVYIQKRDIASGGWIQTMFSYLSNTLKYIDVPMTIISQDGGVIVLANGFNNDVVNVVAHINGKVDKAVNTVYDYLDDYNVYVPENDITSGIDLVRTGPTTVEINVLDIDSQNYPTSPYTSSLERYTDRTLTGTPASSVSLSGSIPITGVTMPVPDLTTVAYYFAEHFTFTASNGTSVDLKNQVLDIRGIAYLRNNAFDDYSIINNPAMRVVADRFSTYDISADGSVVVWFTENRLAIYKNRILSDELTGIGMYPYRHVSIAMSGDAKKCVIFGGDTLNIFNTVSGKVLRVYPINNNLTFGTPINLSIPLEYSKIHGVSMSMDGNTILISGHNSNNIEGYAHIYTYSGGSWSNTGDLSSSVVPNYNKQYKYGITNALSGDGKTAVIIGTSQNADLYTDIGYVWKFNEINRNWTFLQKLIVTGTTSQSIISCSLSHMGNTMIIYIQDIKWMLFEYADLRYVDWADFLITPAIGYYSTSFNGSLSGDGNTFAYSAYKNTITTDTIVHIYKRVAGLWNLTNITVVDTTSKYAYDPLVKLSFDGGIIVLGNGRFYDSSEIYNQFTHINGKVGKSVDTVYDYLNDYSSYIGILDPEWDPSGSLQVHNNITGANYPSGHWDAMSLSYNGKYMLVGSPNIQTVTLYNIDENTSIEFSKATTNFGCRCAMDDAADYVVISDDTYLYVYRVTGQSLLRTLTRTSPSTVPWNLKMSKDGNVIILTEVLGASTIYKWESGGNWATASVDNTSITKPALMVNLFSIDLSYDGSVIVASGKFKIWVRDNGVDHVHDCTDILTSTSIGDSGQSVAISAYPSVEDGKYVIVAGMPRPYGSPPSNWHICSIYSVRYKDNQFERRNGTNGIQTVTLPSANTARYGRSVSIDLLGRWALYSGSHETNVTSGGAVLFNLNANHTTATFDYSSSSENVRYIHVSGLTDQVSNGIYSHRGFGVQCKLSSDGSVFAVSGDTVIKSYKSINRTEEINQGERLPDPYFDLSVAIRDLSIDTSYDSLTYNGITIVKEFVYYVFDSTKGDIYITREGLTKKYARLPQPGHSFGIFSVGLSNFTIAFVLRSYVEGTGDPDNQGRLTYGLDPDDIFNFHFSANYISFYPFVHNDPDVQGEKGKFVNSLSNYTLMFASYNKDVDNGKLTFLLRNESNKFVKEFVNMNDVISDRTNPRTFTIISANSIPQHIYEMLIFHEYIGTDRLEYPIFGRIEDMANDKYGIMK